MGLPIEVPLTYSGLCVPSPFIKHDMPMLYTAHIETSPICYKLDLLMLSVEVPMYEAERDACLLSPRTSTCIYIA
jgi:hypothetical protein